MKTIGIIGGIGPETTVAYYNQIIAHIPILGGTELSLILTEPSYGGIPVLDTTQIHVRRIVDESLA